MRGWLDNGEPRCLGFGGIPVDDAIAREVLRVVQPAAVEAAIVASEHEARRQAEVVEALRRGLEAARYAAQRAQRQYDATDPENRLVAGGNSSNAGTWPYNAPKRSTPASPTTRLVSVRRSSRPRPGRSSRSWRRGSRRCGTISARMFA